MEACRTLSGLRGGADVNQVVCSEIVRGTIARGLAQLKAQGGGSSTYATRALLMPEPPSVDGGEITDKGYVNQHAVLTRRFANLEELNLDQSPAWILCEP
jgi:feruloyl-CoA synthase